MNIIARQIQIMGQYYLLMYRTFSRPESWKMFRQLFFREVENIGIGSLGIVTIISVFMGAVVTIQTAANIDSPLIPAYSVGYASRQTVILEFAPTILALIFAGKIGSNIASELGTMRISEQIDALEIMGINSAQFLILPKICAAVFINPFLVIISMFQGLFGGWLFGSLSGVVLPTQFIYGLQYGFRPFDVTYALIKTLVFAFLITSISAFHGYYVRGGALEIGKASTRAVVSSSIFILLFNYIITQLLLI
jgi:phospholipid/cholesterol/gamma-HCH transport system permease protein